jgi:penicillin-insensitive murein endopeptidase
MLAGVQVAPLLIALLAVDAGAVNAGAPDAAAPARDRRFVAEQWQAQRVPAAGPALSIGACSSGCLQGAAMLPASGRGYEALRLGRNRRFGHPSLVAYIQRLARSVSRDNLGLIVVGDLSQPRGGPTPTGHRSHQTGLDADIGYLAPPGAHPGLSAKMREQLSPPAVVDAKTHQKTAAWTPKILKLLALAAGDPAVDRIFVDPGIKKIACADPTAAKAAWQGRLRPWWNHHDHFHVRLRCPADSPLCVPQDPPPDDGCGASLAWWFTGDAEATRTKKKEADAQAEPALPPACAPLVQPALSTSSSEQSRR